MPATSHFELLGLNHKEAKNCRKLSLALLQNLLHLEKMFYRRHNQSMRIHC